jgi:hypothetical protein
MKKYLLTLVTIMLFTCLAHSQVGINNTSPKSTLDITGVTAATIPDGVLVPRFTVAELARKDAAYGSAQNGTLVFVTSGTGSIGKTVNIKGSGFYYYDHPASKWKGMGGGPDDVLQDNGAVVQDIKALASTGANAFSIHGGDAGNDKLEIETSTPTTTLDILGNTRVRTITPVSGATIVTPIYSDANGILVKASSDTYGGVVTNITDPIAPGATGTLITGVAEGFYKGVILVGDGCINVGTADYYLHNVSFNNFYSIRGQGGIVSSNGSTPVFIQTVKNVVSTTWNIGVTGCQDGSNTTGLDYTVTIPSAGTVNITNNGNVSRDYKIILTRLD